MDFKSTKRKELQALCKKHGLRTNSTNAEMAEALSSLLATRDKAKLRGCLKGSGGSSGVDGAKPRVASKKVSFSLEEEKVELEDLRETRRRSRRRSVVKFHSEKLCERIDSEKDRCEDPVKCIDVPARITRSRRAAVAVVWSPVVEEKKTRKGTDGVRRSDEQKQQVENLVSENESEARGEKVVSSAGEPAMRSLRNRVVVVGGNKEMGLHSKPRRAWKKNDGDEINDAAVEEGGAAMKEPILREEPMMRLLGHNVVVIGGHGGLGENPKPRRSQRKRDAVREEEGEGKETTACNPEKGSCSLELGEGEVVAMRDLRKKRPRGATLGGEVPASIVSEKVPLCNDPPPRRSKRNAQHLEILVLETDKQGKKEVEGSMDGAQAGEGVEGNKNEIGRGKKARRQARNQALITEGGEVLVPGVAASSNISAAEAHKEKGKFSDISEPLRRSTRNSSRQNVLDHDTIPPLNENLAAASGLPKENTMRKQDKKLPSRKGSKQSSHPSNETETESGALEVQMEHQGVEQPELPRRSRRNAAKADIPYYDIRKNNGGNSGHDVTTGRKRLKKSQMDVLLMSHCEEPLEPCEQLENQLMRTACHANFGSFVIAGSKPLCKKNIGREKVNKMARQADLDKDITTMERDTREGIAPIEDSNEFQTQVSAGSSKSGGKLHDKDEGLQEECSPHPFVSFSEDLFEDMNGKYLRRKSSLKKQLNQIQESDFSGQKVVYRCQDFEDEMLETDGNSEETTDGYANGGSQTGKPNDLDGESASEMGQGPLVDNLVSDKSHEEQVQKIGMSVFSEGARDDTDYSFRIKEKHSDNATVLSNDQDVSLSNFVEGSCEIVTTVSEEVPCSKVESLLDAEHTAEDASQSKMYVINNVSLPSPVNSRRTVVQANIEENCEFTAPIMMPDNSNKFVQSFSNEVGNERSLTCNMPCYCNDAEKPPLSTTDETKLTINEELPSTYSKVTDAIKINLDVLGCSTVHNDVNGDQTSAVLAGQLAEEVKEPLVKNSNLPSYEVPKEVKDVALSAALSSASEKVAFRNGVVKNDDEMFSTDVGQPMLYVGGQNGEHLAYDGHLNIIGSKNDKKAEASNLLDLTDEGKEFSTKVLSDSEITEDPGKSIELKGNSMAYLDGVKSDEQAKDTELEFSLSNFRKSSCKIDEAGCKRAECLSVAKVKGTAEASSHRENEDIILQTTGCKDLYKEIISSFDGAKVIVGNEKLSELSDIEETSPCKSPNIRMMAISNNFCSFLKAGSLNCKTEGTVSVRSGINIDIAMHGAVSVDRFTPQSASEELKTSDLSKESSVEARNICTSACSPLSDGHDTHSLNVQLEESKEAIAHIYRDVDVGSCDGSASDQTIVKNNVVIDSSEIVGYDSVKKSYGLPDNIHGVAEDDIEFETCMKLEDEDGHKKPHETAKKSEVLKHKKRESAGIDHTDILHESDIVVPDEREGLNFVVSRDDSGVCRRKDTSVAGITDEMEMTLNCNLHQEVEDQEFIANDEKEFMNTSLEFSIPLQAPVDNDQHAAETPQYMTSCTATVNGFNCQALKIDEKAYHQGTCSSHKHEAGEKTKEDHVMALRECSDEGINSKLQSGTKMQETLCCNNTVITKTTSAGSDIGWYMSISEIDQDVATSVEHGVGKASLASQQSQVYSPDMIGLRGRESCDADVVDDVSSAKDDCKKHTSVKERQYCIYSDLIIDAGENLNVLSNQSDYKNYENSYRRKFDDSEARVKLQHQTEVELVENRDCLDMLECTSCSKALLEHEVNENIANFRERGPDLAEEGSDWQLTVTNCHNLWAEAVLFTSSDREFTIEELDSMDGCSSEHKCNPLPIAETWENDEVHLRSAENYNGFVNAKSVDLDHDEDALALDDPSIFLKGLFHMDDEVGLVINDSSEFVSEEHKHESSDPIKSEGLAGIKYLKVAEASDEQNTKSVSIIDHRENCEEDNIDVKREATHIASESPLEVKIGSDSSRCEAGKLLEFKDGVRVEVSCDTPAAVLENGMLSGDGVRCVVEQGEEVHRECCKNYERIDGDRDASLISVEVAGISSTIEINQGVVDADKSKSEEDVVGNNDLVASLISEEAAGVSSTVEINQGVVNADESMFEEDAGANNDQVAPLISEDAAGVSSTIKINQGVVYADESKFEEDAGANNDQVSSFISEEGAGVTSTIETNEGVVNGDESKFDDVAGSNNDQISSLTSKEGAGVCSTIKISQGVVDGDESKSVEDAGANNYRVASLISEEAVGVSSEIEISQGVVSADESKFKEDSGANKDQVASLISEETASVSIIIETNQGVVDADESKFEEDDGANNDRVVSLISEEVAGISSTIEINLGVVDADESKFKEDAGGNNDLVASLISEVAAGVVDADESKFEEDAGGNNDLVASLISEVAAGVPSTVEINQGVVNADESMFKEDAGSNNDQVTSLIGEEVACVSSTIKINQGVVNADESKFKEDVEANNDRVASLISEKVAGVSSIIEMNQGIVDADEFKFEEDVGADNDRVASLFRDTTTTKINQEVVNADESKFEEDAVSNNASNLAVFECQSCNTEVESHCMTADSFNCSLKSDIGGLGNFGLEESSRNSGLDQIEEISFRLINFRISSAKKTSRVGIQGTPMKLVTNIKGQHLHSDIKDKENTPLCKMGRSCKPNMGNSGIAKSARRPLQSVRKEEK